MARVLIIDDEPEFGQELSEQLSGRGYEVQFLDCAEEGLHALAAGTPFEVILLDNNLPRMNGMDFLTELREHGGSPPVILMTNAHRDQTVIQAINLGAFSYVIKPVRFADFLTEIEPEIRAALDICKPPKPVHLKQSRWACQADESSLVGTSKPMLEVLKLIGRLARMDGRVLILGETGTGKDLVARALHTNSRRQSKPFVAMNCAAFNDNLLDDELFGHVPGAFTGADKLRKGRFEHAHGGTLFLDEVGDMPPNLQVKLLRVLENHEVERLGSNEPIKVDVRVVSATHRNLDAEIRAGRFRQDLYYRLEDMKINLPPLRERREDIPLLAECFLARIRGDDPGPELHPDALKQLAAYHWPGNIRQLQKVLYRAVGLCRGPQILPTDLELEEAKAVDAPPRAVGDEAEARAVLRAVVSWAWQSGQEKLLPRLQELLERELLEHGLADPKISKVQLAQRLGIARGTLLTRLDEYRLNAPDNE
jgi:DNA-binding NtrC family response regulator